MEALKLKVSDREQANSHQHKTEQKVSGSALISFNSHTKCCDKIMKTSENPRRGHWATLSFAEITVDKRCVRFIPQIPEFNDEQTLNLKW